MQRATIAAALLALGLAACGDDIDPPGNTSKATLIVVYAGASETVKLADTTPVDIDGEPYARLADVALLALAQGTDLKQLVVDFEASDGFKPGVKDDCKTLIPMPGSKLTSGYIHLVSRNVRWDDALNHPGCMRPKDLARMILADK